MTGYLDLEGTPWAPDVLVREYGVGISIEVLSRRCPDIPAAKQFISPEGVRALHRFLGTLLEAVP